MHFISDTISVSCAVPTQMWLQKGIPLWIYCFFFFKLVYLESLAILLKPSQGGGSQSERNTVHMQSNHQGEFWNKSSI